MQGPDELRKSRSAGVEVLSFLRDSFYNLTYHATAGGSLGLALVVSQTKEGNWVKNPLVLILGDTFPQKAKNC